MRGYASDESDPRPDLFRLPEELRGLVADVLRDELVRACLAAVHRGVDPADVATSITERTARLRLPLVGQQYQQPLGEVGQLLD